MKLKSVKIINENTKDIDYNWLPEKVAYVDYIFGSGENLYRVVEVQEATFPVELYHDKD